MALGHLGGKTSGIQSFAEKSTEARACATWYEQCRREVLEAHDWTFARSRLAMPLHADLPPAEWAFRYQVPADCIIDRRLWNPLGDGQTSIFGNSVDIGQAGDAVPYELETSIDGTNMTLLTNLSAATLIYTRDISLTSMFSAQFINALSHYIAAKIAFGITMKPMIEDKEVKAFQSAMRVASGADANRGRAGAIRDAYAVRSRL